MKITALLFAILLAGLFSPLARAEKQLNIYCWDEYLPKDVLEDFTKQTGIM